MDRAPFRLVLINTASTNEFNNTNSNFKNRLPVPIRLEGDWEVALDDIALPGSTSFAEKLNPHKRTLMQTSYNARGRQDPSDNDRKRMYTKAFTHDNLLNVTPTVDGVGFMKSMMNELQQARIESTAGGAYPRFAITNRVDGLPYRTYWKWKWEGNDLVSDNSQTFKSDNNGLPWFIVDVLLAQKMGWLVYNSDSSEYELGPNLTQELFDWDIVPQLDGTPPGDVRDSSGNYVFWTVNDFLGGVVSNDRGYLRLSYYCNWRFSNLNAAFQEAVGNTRRTLLLYSDVCTPSVVGSQKVDMLREFAYEGNTKGTVYFEPHRLQHLEVRNSTLDIISVQIAEKNGDIARFHQGVTTVTLHFNPI